MPPRLPDFFIIGAAKSGTTSLYGILDQHPQIFMPKVKEPEFFARDELYARGIESYAQAFAAARPDQLVGEASTIYTLSPFFPEAAARIRRHAPEAKLVYIMREPVSRAYSFYVQIIKNYQNVTHDYAVHRSFEEFIEPGARAGAAPRERVFSPANAHLPDAPDLCLAGSDYPMQIKAYLEQFDPARILFLKFDDFVADRVATMARITDFLGVDRVPDAVFATQGATRNVAADHFAEVGGLQAVDRLKTAAGPLWALRTLLPRGLRDRARKAASGMGGAASHEPPPMRPETKHRLRARFAADRPRLAELTGLSFDDWG